MMDDGGFVVGARNCTRHRRQRLGQPHGASAVCVHDAASHGTHLIRRQDPGCLSRDNQGGQVPHRRPRRQGQVFRVHQRNLQQDRMSPLAYTSSRLSVSVFISLPDRKQCCQTTHCYDIKLNY